MFFYASSFILFFVSMSHLLTSYLFTSTLLSLLLLGGYLFYLLFARILFRERI
jgi:hypothetical protein